MRRKSDTKKFHRHFLAAVLALAVMLVPAQTALATDGGAGSEREIPAVSYYGQARRFVFTPGTEENPADLFDMFKGLMPGDTREQEITLRSAAASRAPINLFLRAYVPALDENATEAERAEAEKANAFLRRLTLTVTSDKFADQPELDAGLYPEQGMGDWVFLGRFAYNTTSVLKVTVEVPANLKDVTFNDVSYNDTYTDNDFQDIKAVIRWAFLVEEFNDTGSPDNPGGGTEDPTDPTPGGSTENPAGPAPGTVPGGTGGQAAVAAAPGAADDGTGLDLAQLEDIPAPLAPPADEELGLADEEVPLAAFDLSSWALLNLLLMAVTVLMTGALLVTYFSGRKEKEEAKNGSAGAAPAAYNGTAGEAEKEEWKREGLPRILSIVPAVVSAVFFFLTEDMRSPMVLVDRWTLWMLLFAVADIVLAVLSVKRKEMQRR